MNEKSIKKLLEERKLLLEKLSSLSIMIDGSLVKGKKKCGRKSCKCARGDLHRHVVISQRRENKTEIIYVSLANEKAASAATASYSEATDILQRICDINVKLFKASRLLEEAKI